VAKLGSLWGKFTAADAAMGKGYPEYLINPKSTYLDSRFT
jgi:hypothetical protein